jgi:hypothetical protein
MNENLPQTPPSPPANTPEFPLTDTDKLKWLETLLSNTPNKEIEAGVERQIQQLKKKLGKDD